MSKTEWVYGFKVGLAVSPTVVVTAFGLSSANCDERPIGEFLVSSDGHDAYLADKGLSPVAWERRWLGEYGARVAAAPQESAKRAWSGRLSQDIEFGLYRLAAAHIYALAPPLRRPARQPDAATIDGPERG